MITLNKHVKWRKDNNKILICDCKRLIDLKLDLDKRDFMNKLSAGINESNLLDKEKLGLDDFKKLNLLSNLEIKKLKKEELIKSFKILSNEIEERQRNNQFLLGKFKKYPQFFIGLFLDQEIIGVIFGFPREDYLLISEIVIDFRFQNRGFGKKLINEFEKVAKGKYNNINVGARDNSIDFYKKLKYKPFLLFQYKKRDYSLDDFNKLKIIREREYGKDKILEVKTDKANINSLNKLRKQYSKSYIQYIFTKNIS